MKIYSCESHIDQAIDVFIASRKNFRSWRKYRKTKSYPQIVLIVTRLHI